MSSGTLTPSKRPSPTVTPGSNWKALKKTLDSSPGGSSNGLSRRRRPTSSSSDVAPPPSHSSSYKGKSRALEANHRDGVSSASASPAPTSLPWFAEDLSPDDLALVRRLNQQGSGASASTSQWSNNAVGPDAEARLRKQVILGGLDESDLASRREPGQYIAIDCEMVGVGVKGSESILARVSIVNWHGYVLLDRFVKPKEKVTDYRTWVSGIRAKDLKGAPTLEAVQEEVAKLIKGRVLVGHAIQNDLKALLLSHPRPLIRDTSTFKPLRDLAQTKYPGLKKLAKIVLDIDVQGKGEEHSSVEDARTTMAIFRTQKDAWEKSLKPASRSHTTTTPRVGAGQPPQPGVSAQEASEGAKIEQNMRRGAGTAVAGGEVRRKKRTESAPDWWKEGM